MRTEIETTQRTRLSSAVALRTALVLGVTFAGYGIVASGILPPIVAQRPAFACPNADDPFAPTRRGSVDAATVGADLVSASAGLRQALGHWNEQPGGETLAEFRAAAAERKARFVTAMREAPEVALQQVLTATEGSRVSGVAGNCVETPVQEDGILSILFADGLPSTHLSKPIYLLETSRGETFNLHPVNAPQDFRSGTKLRIRRGVRIGRDLLFDAAPVAAAGMVDTETGTTEAATAPPQFSTGEQRVAVILANFSNSPVPTVTPESVNRIVFDEMDAYFQENSYGKVTLTGSVYGWYTLPITQRCEGYSSYQIRDLAMQAANADVDFRAFNRIIVVAPYGGFEKCGWIGMSQVGPRNTLTPDGTVLLSSAWVDAGSSYLWTYAHEFGHSLGNYHAQFIDCAAQQYYGGTGCSIPRQDEYGDRYDMMGWGQGHFTVQHKLSLGWLDPGSVITAENQAATYVLEPLESDTPGVKGIAIPRPSPPGFSLTDTLYVEFRRPMGFDRILNERGDTDVFTGVLLHARGAEATATGLLDPTEPYHDAFHAALPVGATYTDPPSGFQIAVLRISDSEAVVSIAPGRVTTSTPPPPGTTGPKFNGTGPTTTIRYPREWNTVSGTITLSVDATGPKGVQRVEFYHDYSIPAPVKIGEDTTAPYTLSVDTTKLPNGYNHFTILAFDRAGEPYGVDGNKTMVGVFFSIKNGGDATPPQVSITSPTNGANLQSPVTVTATATDNRGVWYVDFFSAGSTTKLSRSYYPPCTLKLDVPEGVTQRIYARAVDFVGNATASSIVTFTGAPDTTQPIVSITSPVTGSVLPGGVVQVRVDAQDSGGVETAELTVNGVLTDWAFSPPPYTFRWDTRALPSGTYTLQALAYDPTYNEGASAPITVTLLSERPTAQLLRPVDGARVEGGVELEASATSPYGIRSIDFYRDTFALLGTVSAPPYVRSWDGQAPFGLHALHALARDTVGNTTATPPALVTLTDLTPPTVSFLRPSVDGALVRATILVNARVSDANGVASVDLSVDGASLTQWTAAYAATYIAFPYGLDTTTLSDGAHTLRYHAVDRYGNERTVERQIITDNTAPEVGLLAPATGTRLGNSVSLSALARDLHQIAWVEFAVDGTVVGGDVPDTGDINIDTLEEMVQYGTTWYPYPENLTTGNHTVTATAVDFAGNRGTTEPVTVYIDATPPTAAVTSPTTGTVPGITFITALAIDDIGVTHVEFLRNAETAPFATATSAPYTATVASRFFPEGPHTLFARAYDALGNVGTSPMVSVTVDQTKPTGTLQRPLAGTTLTALVVLEASASDNFGVGRVQFLLDGSTVIGTATASPFTATWNSGTTANGTHRISVRVVDNAGNSYESPKVSVTVTNTAAAPIGGGRQKVQEAPP